MKHPTDLAGKKLQTKVKLWQRSQATSGGATRVKKRVELVTNDNSEKKAK